MQGGGARWLRPNRSTRLLKSASPLSWARFATCRLKSQPM
nr:MAG TPA: protein of unknown function (DUF5555) [Caudoviricetes sp.]